MIPQSLADVSDATAAGDSFDRCFSNLLDAFYAQPCQRFLDPVPTLLAPKFADAGHVQDAYLAATAEELARKYALTVPAWVRDESRKLHRPWFASTLAGLRAVLIHESPPGFRSRNLFVSENALSRA